MLLCWRRIKLILATLLGALLIWQATPAFAGPKDDLPRYVSLKFNTVNARAGPAYDCPIDWVYKQKMLPVKVVAVFDTWRKIIDPYGDGGWIHESSLSIKRSIIVNSDNNIELYKNPSNRQVIAIIEPKSIGRLIKEAENWCKIEFSVSPKHKVTGWLQRKNLWGV